MHEEKKDSVDLWLQLKIKYDGGDKLVHVSIQRNVGRLRLRLVDCYMVALTNSRGW